MRSTNQSAHVQPGRGSSSVHAREAAVQHLLDLELPVGIEPRRRRDGQSLLDDDRSAPSGLAGIRDARVSAKMFLQGIAGTLELFHLSLLRFQQMVGELTGHPVAVYQRVDQAGQKLPIDAGILDDTDTLMVFGLDHLVTEQEAAPGKSKPCANGSSGKARA